MKIRHKSRFIKSRRLEKGEEIKQPEGKMMKGFLVYF